MRFTSPTLLSVFLITFVSAVPASDKYKHFKDPGCPGVDASCCSLVDYCNRHLKLGDLFTTRIGNLKSRDSPEPENLDFNLTDTLSPSLPSSFTARELDVNWKRSSQSSQCGTLSCVTGRDLSNQFDLVAGVIYDLVVDYPYNGATGGTIGVIVKLTINGVARIRRLGAARTDFGGVRFSFFANPNAEWYRVIFRGDNVAVAALNWYIKMQ